MEIHEHPVVNGTVGIIKEKIEHLVNFDHPNWKIKHKEYAKWDAKRFVEMDAEIKKKNILSNSQKLKYSILKSPFSGIIFFLGSFFIMLGFIDGLRGLKYARLKAFYFNNVFTEIKKLT